MPLQVEGLGALAESMRDTIAGEIARDVPMAKLSTYRIGGPAAIVVSPSSPDDVAAVVQACAESETPILTLGLGSNVLCPDEGFPGVVIRMGKGLGRLDAASDEEDEGLWTVGAGLPTPRLAKLSVEAGWSGAHRLIGVPGTVGGGVVMNAGAHGQDFSQIVRRVDVVTCSGALEHRAASSIPWQYRDAGIRDAIVVGCQIALSRAPVADLQRDTKKYLQWRQRGTPFKEPCCGSVFRNPEPDSDGVRRTAGQLIDGLGMKGFAIGGAMVSPKHANYIVNTGSATPGEVMAVIDAVRERVRTELAIELELEVKVLGE